MTLFFYRLFRAFKYASLTKRIGAIRILSRHPKLDLSLLDADKESGAILLKGTRIDVTAPKNEFLLVGLDSVGRLVREAKAIFTAAGGEVFIEVQGVRLRLDNWEELFIAAEIFAESIYNLKLGRPFVAIDIGMNVGTASLFFARNQNCQAVYSFEPFPKTLSKARVNLSLNPSFSGKIQATAKGVASRQFETELDYMEEFKGSVGMNGLPEYINPGRLASQVEKVRVEFLACTGVISEIASKHPDTLRICKVDCEGAEYEILEALARANQLSQIDCFMIEWHLKGAAPLEALLMKHGFTVLSFAPSAPTHSMIYAWQQVGAGGSARLRPT